MKKSKFTEEQIAFALKQAESGTSVDEICRKMGISQAMFYAWRKKFGGLGVSQQAVTAYESGQRRVPISLLPLLASTLGVTVEDLIGVPASRSSGKRGPAPKLQQQLEQIEALPKARQRVVSQMIDAMLQANASG